ncbi:uncharacterized protein LOC142349755 isoform X2 [Convolutriloba macropyga]|uniref:uncharacterized protein LOC142349755 isoform X2 n=1 Tax=Convolutriloba macropyga TaxID=536237 RepID=UPI003F5244AB
MRNCSSRHFCQTDRPDKNCGIAKGTQRGRWLSNGQFHFDAGHQYPWKFMEHVNQSYGVNISDRHQAGPKVAWEVAKNMYGLKNLTNQVVEAGKANRHMTILPDFSFLPSEFSSIGNKLYPGTARTPQEWDALFKCSYTVHFYSNTWGHKAVSGDPKLDAYSYLGPTHCPNSFKFWKQEF